MCNRSDDEENLRTLKYFSSHTGLPRGPSPDRCVESLSTEARTNDNMLRYRDLEFLNHFPSPRDRLFENIGQQRTDWNTSRRVSEAREEASPENNSLMGSFRFEVDRELEESSVSSQEMAPSPSLRSLAHVSKTVTVVLGNKSTRHMQFQKPVVLASNILERIQEMLEELDIEKLNLPTDVAQIRLKRKDQLLESRDEVMDGDVVYALSKSEAIRESIDEKKENRSSRPRRSIHEVLEKLKTRQRQRPRMRPVFHGPVFPRGGVSDSADFSQTTSRPCPLNSMMSLSSKDFMHEEVRKPRPTSNSRVVIQGLKAKLHELENESNDIKIENEELLNLVRQTLNQTEKERKKLIEMECNLKRKKIEVSSLAARNEELLTENKKLIEERCVFEQKAKDLEVQLDNEKKYTNVMGMGIALPKEIPKDQEKLEKTIDSLQQIIKKLRSQQVENYKARMQCTICYDLNWNTALIPCGHCLCAVCARRVTSCPQCRQHIERRQRMPMRSPNNMKNFELW